MIAKVVLAAVIEVSQAFALNPKCVIEMSIYRAINGSIHMIWSYLTTVIFESSDELTKLLTLGAPKSNQSNEVRRSARLSVVANA